MGSEETRLVVDRLYEAYLGGDLEGMLATLSDDVSFRFLAQGEGQGIEEARRFFAYSSGKLTDLDFRIERKVIDGDRAAVTWTETARTAAGAPWENHGVDVFGVVDGEIVSLHENNDVRLVYEHFEPYVPPDS